MDTPKILIVEDDHFLSSIIKSRMEKSGFLVDQAYDGVEGLEKIKSFQPNLIILDLIMPRMSGFEFMEQISSDPEFNQVPILIASNLGQDSDVQKARALGAIDYYVKVRTSIDDLDNMIKNVIAQRFGGAPPAELPGQVAPSEQPQGYQGEYQQYDQPQQ